MIKIQQQQQPNGEEILKYSCLSQTIKKGSDKTISPLPHTLSFGESIQALGRQNCKPEEQGRQTSNDKAKPRKHREQPQRRSATNSSATPLQAERHTQEKLLLENGQREVHNDIVESTADV